MTRHGLSTQNILPIWHRITKDYVIAQSPALAGVIALPTSSFTIAEIAAEIARVVRLAGGGRPGIETAMEIAAEAVRVSPSPQ